MRCYWNNTALLLWVHICAPKTVFVFHSLYCQQHTSVYLFCLVIATSVWRDIFQLRNGCVQFCCGTLQSHFELFEIAWPFPIHFIHENTILFNVSFFIFLNPFFVWHSVHVQSFCFDGVKFTLWIIVIESINLILWMDLTVFGIFYSNLNALKWLIFYESSQHCIDLKKMRKREKDLWNIQLLLSVSLLFIFSYLVRGKLLIVELMGLVRKHFRNKCILSILLKLPHDSIANFVKFH